MMDIPKLPEVVAKDFNCIKVLPGEVIWRGKKYDLTKIDTATANRLVDEKFPYLTRKTVVAATKVETPVDKNSGPDKGKN